MKLFVTLALMALAVGVAALAEVGKKHDSTRLEANSYAIRGLPQDSISWLMSLPNRPQVNEEEAIQLAEPWKHCNADYSVVIVFEGVRQQGVRVIDDGRVERQ